MNVKRMVIRACLAAAVCLGATACRAATYYVDFDAGRDAAAGTSPQAAFKHCPGDPTAEGTAAQTRFAPGDTVVFKGGVLYRGNLEVRWSGEPGRPITYDGNSAGKFGRGPAVLDGGEPVTGWRRCASADECGGNPNWKKLYTATIPGGAKGLTALSAGLVQDERMLFPAQYPNPEDPFYSGDERSYLALDAAPTRTTLADPRLAEIGGRLLVGSYLYVTTEHNMVEYLPITAWDAAANTVTFRKAYRQPTKRYAIVNCPSAAVLDRPGEYVFADKPAADGRHAVTVWPWNNKDPARCRMTFTVRRVGIEFGRRNVRHVTIRGLRIQNFHQAIHGQNVEGVTIRDNEITRIRTPGAGSAVYFVVAKDHLVADNHIHDCPRSNAIQTRTGRNVVYRRNRVRMVGRSPLRFYDIQHGQIIGNTVIDCRGVHSNPLTVYLGCRDILVARNEVHRSNIGITLQSAERIYVINNVFTSPRGASVGIWPGRPTRHYYFLNNVIGIDDGAFYVNDPGAEKFVIKNNIITGIEGFPLRPDNTLSHNLYVGVRKHLNDGEFTVADLAAVVTDPAGYDFRPKPAGPAVDMGTDVSQYYPRETFPDFDFDTDFAGNPRTYGAAVDIGPFEARYQPGALDNRPPIVTGPAAEPKVPLADFTRIPDAEPIVIAATDFSAEDGGKVVRFDKNRLATTDFVKYWNAEGHWLEYAVDAPAAGDYAIALRYTSQFAAPRQVSVGGKVVKGLESVELAATGGWVNWKLVRLPAPVPLAAGRNVLRLTSLGGRGINLDEIRLSRAGQPDIVVTAGAVTGQGGGKVEVVPSPRLGLFKFWNVADHWLEWAIDDARPGTYEVVLRYATLANSPRSLSVNGRLVEGLESFLLDRTAGWRVCRDVSLPVPVVLKEGRNVLRLTSLGGGGMNLDEIRLIPVRQHAGHR